VDLGTVPIVRNGEWRTPVKIDPFTIDQLDVHDWLVGIDGHLQDIVAARGAPRSRAWQRSGKAELGGVAVIFKKQERIFASTEGSLCTQTISVVQPNFKLGYHKQVTLEIPNFNTPVQGGWERLSETPIVDLFITEMDKADTAPPPPPSKPAEVGRYDMIFSPRALAKILSGTFGDATQVDRALGYEANASGTSYLGPDPLTQLGTVVASPLVTITADRSAPLGLATVKWDDEGVVPEDFTLVKDGTFVNYQTSREQAAWLAPWAHRQDVPVRSTGCAMAPSAQEVTMQHTPNLALQPGKGTADIESLVQDMDHGILVDWVNLQMDWQCLDGYCTAIGATEIRNGKRVAQLKGAALLFRADQFWKGVQALGGPASVAYLGGFVSGKGEPAQYTAFSIGVVPARVKQLALINPLRKAS
jgi:TldD protein